MLFGKAIQCFAISTPVLLAALAAKPLQADETSLPRLSWRSLPDLPNKHGLAGPFVGVHRGAVIVAGGANFPDGVPWRPAPDCGISRKQYHDRIYRAAQACGDDDLVAKLRGTQRRMYDEHPGFSRAILLYGMHAGAWEMQGALPFTSHVTTQAVRWRDGIVIPTGEKRPGIRTYDVWFATLAQ